MIVRNTGYINLDKVLEMLSNKEVFGIYKTHRNTTILVKQLYIGPTSKRMRLFNPKSDRLPYKTVEGKKITNCAQLLFDSQIDSKELLNSIKENQLMSYIEFSN